MEKLFEGTKTLYRGKKGSREEVPVSSLGGEGKVLGLYFSAHWCPPCILFNPDLVDWYNRLNKSGKELEIVFISFDTTEEDYEEHFSTMNWLALPYQHKEIKDKLVRKYRITGVPTLVLIDCSKLSLITRDGRYYVLNDRDGDGFPWQPETLDLCLTEGYLEDREGVDVAWNDIKDSIKVLGLFFSAHWCQPCQSFTSQLKNFYDKLKKKNGGFSSHFEVIFVSSDNEKSTFREYCSIMPWLMVPFNDSKCQKLRQIYDISDIPSLIIVDSKTGRVITANGRTMVGMDPDGKDFPWYPKPLELLDERSVSIINDHSSIVLFTDGSPDQLQLALKALSPVAEEYYTNGSKVPSEDDDDLVRFFYSNDSDLAASLREEVLRIPEDFPVLVMVDIPGQRKHVCESKELTKETVECLLSSLQGNTLQWTKL